MQTKRHKKTVFVYGIGQEKQLDEASICGGADKVAKVGAHISFFNKLKQRNITLAVKPESRCSFLTARPLFNGLQQYF